MRQANLNEQIPSQERATVRSLDSLLSSAGGVVVQPVFGKVADVWSYQACLVLSAVVQAVAPPFIRLTRREKVDADLVASL